MNATDHAVAGPARSLPDQVASILIEVPRERVWSEITRTGSVQKALYNTVLDTELRPGAKLRYYSPDRKRVFIVGEVVAVDAPRSFSHTYWFTTWKSGPPTLVTWELEDQGDACQVTVSHSGWTEEHDKPEKSGAGWKQILGLLKHELETGDIPMGTKLMYSIMGWFMFAMPATTKTEYIDQHHPG